MKTVSYKTFKAAVEKDTFIPVGKVGKSTLYYNKINGEYYVGSYNSNGTYGAEMELVKVQPQYTLNAKEKGQADAYSSPDHEANDDTLSFEMNLE